MPRLQRIRLTAGGWRPLGRFVFYAPVHSVRHVLVGRKRWRNRRSRSGDWKTKRSTAHGRRDQCQPNDTGLHQLVSALMQLLLCDQAIRARWRVVRASRRYTKFQAGASNGPSYQGLPVPRAGKQLCGLRTA